MSDHLTNTPRRRPILGCIADDVTGATDLAINLVEGGMAVVQWLDVPSVSQLEQMDADAIVVGLKIRSIPKQAAVTKALECLRAFRRFGIERYFFKYCSTFDSTPEGNIGPVAAALLDEVKHPQTIFCPAFPKNGRTVYQGHLFVYGELLNESGMENHPLNPMTDANLLRVLARQCEEQIGLVTAQAIDAERVQQRLDDLAKTGHRFAIVDTCHETHLEKIAEAVCEMPLITGGSGIGRFLPTAYRRRNALPDRAYTAESPNITGRSLIVAGSCSQATQEQVANIATQVAHWQIDVDRIMNDSTDERERLLQWARTGDPNRPLLVSSTAAPERVAEIQARFGTENAANAIENFLGEVTAEIVTQLGIRRLIVAGGETSGSIVDRLQIQGLRIGREIAPGVPWTTTISTSPIALALKSGNFGGPDFFQKALRMLP